MGLSIIHMSRAKKDMNRGDLPYVEDAFMAATKRSASAGCACHTVLGKRYASTSTLTSAC